MPHSSLVDYLAQWYNQKTVPPLFIAFLKWYEFLWPPRKILGNVSGASINHFCYKGPPLIHLKFSLSKCFIEAPETLQNILCGGYRNPYKFENAIKVVGQFSAFITWAKCIYQEAVACINWMGLKMHVFIFKHRYTMVGLLQYSSLVFKFIRNLETVLRRSKTKKPFICRTVQKL